MTDEIYKKLKDLIQLDVDAVRAYEQAIEKIDVPMIVDHLETFKEDHQRHVDELSAYLIDNGYEVPEQTPDFKGYLIEGFTSFRSVTGTDGALKAMESNEKLTNKKYRKATEWEELDFEARNIIMQGYDDEKNHLSYIEQELHVAH